MTEYEFPVRTPESGAKAAQSSIAADTLALRIHGYPADWLPAFGKLLHANLSVQFQHFGCIVEPGMFEESHAFNAVMEAEIARRFGTDAVKQPKDEAIRSAEDRRSLP